MRLLLLLLAQFFNIITIVVLVNLNVVVVVNINVTIIVNFNTRVINVNSSNITVITYDRYGLVCFYL